MKFVDANLAGWDRAVRLLAGVGLLGFISLPMAAYWGSFGLYPLATGALGFCPIYRLLGVRTAR